MDDPAPRALTRPIPLGRRVRLATVDGARVLMANEDAVAAAIAGDATAKPGAAEFTVVDRGFGRVALETEQGVVSVATSGKLSLNRDPHGEAQDFQWIETLQGDLALMALANHRYLRVDPATRSLSADSPGPSADRADGARFLWQLAGAR